MGIKRTRNAESDGRFGMVRFFVGRFPAWRLRVSLNLEMPEGWMVRGSDR